jgi:transposase
VAKHLPLSELYERFRACDDARLKLHWQVIWLRAQRKGTDKVARITGFKPDWVRQLVRRYNAEGPAGFRNRIKDNGKEPMLSAEQRTELAEALKGLPADGGLWSGPKVAHWIAKKLGRERVCPQTGWEYLRSLGFTLQQPRPRHVAARGDGQQWFKKNSGATFVAFIEPVPARESSSGRKTKRGWAWCPRRGEYGPAKGNGRSR